MRRKLLREGYLLLSGNDLKIVRKAGIELMGDELFDQYIKDEDILDQELQDKIDERSVQFIATNEGIKATDEWGTFATIRNMPETTILQTQYERINQVS